MIRAVCPSVPANRAKKNKIRNRKAAIMQENNEVDHKGNENATAGVGRLNIPLVTVINLSLLKLRK